MTKGKNAQKPFADLTPAEREAAVAEFDAGIDYSKSRPLSKRAKALWDHAKRGRGRPAKRTGEKFARVLITMPPRLLAQTDALAKKRKQNRSQLIADALGAVLRPRNGSRQQGIMRRDSAA